MSLFNDQTVWVVKITLTKKDNSGTATYYLGHEYYDEGELYTSSPVIYPLLAGGIDSMQVERSVGREIAILTQPNIQIHGKACLDDYGKSFFDLGQTYSFQEAQVEFRQYWKPFDSTTTHVDATNIILSALRVKTVDWQGDTLQLGCKQLLFKDREISKRLEVEQFPDIETVAPDYVGEYGPIVFGQSVVINAIPVRSEDVGVGQLQAELDLFAGWVATGHPLNAVNTLYARNQDTSIDATEWFAVTLSSTSPYKGNRNVLAGGLYNLDTSACIVFSPGGSTAVIVHHVGVILQKTGSPVSTDGELVFTLWQAQDWTATSGTWQTTRQLQEIKYDFFTATSLTEVGFVLSPAVVATPGVNYLLEYKWSNPSATAGFKLSKVTAGSNSNDNCQERDNATRGKGWAASSADPNIAMYVVDLGGFTDTTGTAPYKHALYQLNGYGNATGNNSNNGSGLLHVGNSYRLAVTGLEDDGSGTYTGSANSVIKNAADIIRFLLIEDEIGVNHGSANVDTSAFDTARTKASSDGLNLSFAIDSETYASGLIPKILSQSRLILYLTRAGLVSIVYPVNMSTATSYQFKQGQLKDDMTLVGVSESSEDAILNDFLVPFAEDKLNTPKDPEVIRKLRGSSYKEVAYLNDSSASISDAGRIAKAAKSVAIYGRKLYRNALDLYGSGSSAPAKVMKYLFDRWHMKTTTVAIRVPSVDFNAAEILNDAYVSHENLPSSLGTGNDLNSHDSGTGLLWYYNGHPVRICGHGDLSGQIQAIRHVGDEIEFTIENVNPFEAA